jgi:hypothetical protein
MSTIPNCANVWYNDPLVLKKFFKFYLSFAQIRRYIAPIRTNKINLDRHNLIS